MIGNSLLKELREGFSVDLVIFKNANDLVLNLMSPKISFLTRSLISKFNKVKISYKLFSY